MNLISEALIELANSLERAKGPSADCERETTSRSFAPTRRRADSDAFCNDALEDLQDFAKTDPLEDHAEWRGELELGPSVPRGVVEQYTDDIAEAAILNAATVARIGRKWGFGTE